MGNKLELLKLTLRNLESRRRRKTPSVQDVALLLRGLLGDDISESTTAELWLTRADLSE